MSMIFKNNTINNITLCKQLKWSNSVAGRTYYFIFKETRRQVFKDSLETPRNACTHIIYYNHAKIEPSYCVHREWTIDLYLFTQSQKFC